MSHMMPMMWTLTLISSMFFFFISYYSFFYFKNNLFFIYSLPIFIKFITLKKMYKN